MTRRRVAITGIGLVTPVGNDVATTWSALDGVQNGAAPITLFDAAGFPTRIAAEVKGFDERVITAPRKLLNYANRSHRFALAAAEEAMLDSGIAPTDADVWDPAACHGGTHVSEPERAAFAKLCAWGLIDIYRLRQPEPGRYTWWDYRAGNFHKNFGMRIDHLLVTKSVAGRTVAVEIDREARKGKPIPSDHAPLVIDLDEPGHAFDAGWMAAAGRIAARRS